MNLSFTATRRLTVSAACVLAVLLYWYIFSSSQILNLKYIRLSEIYGFLSVVFLYFTMLPGPVYVLFSTAPGKPFINKIRSGLGISAFIFAALHSYITFFIQLKGFKGLAFLTTHYHIALIVGLIPLIILTAMAVTSLPSMKAAVGSYWKKIHNCIYVAGLLIIIHPIIIGAHLHTLNIFSGTFIVATFILLMLETVRFKRFLVTTYPAIQAKYISLGVSLLFFAFIVLVYLAHDLVHFKM